MSGSEFIPLDRYWLLGFVSFVLPYLLKGCSNYGKSFAILGKEFLKFFIPIGALLPTSLIEIPNPSITQF